MLDTFSPRKREGCKIGGKELTGEKKGEGGTIQVEGGEREGKRGSR